MGRFDTRRRDRDRAYSRFLDVVAPSLERAPRAHVFARPPLTEVPPGPLPAVAVCISSGAANLAAVTRDSLHRQVHPPAAVLSGDPGVALQTAAPLVTFVAAGDVLAPVALQRVVQAAAMAPSARVFTTDEDVLGPRGRHSPRLLPGPSPDLLLATDLSSALLAVDRRRALEVWGTLGAAWRYELMLRLAGPDGEGHAHVPQILFHRGPLARGPRPRAVQEAAASVLAERDDGATVEPLIGGGHRIRWPVPTDQSVDIVVLFRDKPELLSRCVDSLFAETEWERLHVVLMDNGSTDPAMAALLERLGAEDQITVLCDDRPFNFAGLNNAAARECHGDHIVFLNNDTVVTDPRWLHELVAEAARPSIGAVAPVLLFPDGTVQHAGAALGIGDYAGHPFAGLEPDARTAFGSPGAHTRNWLAVTAACLMVQRNKFDEVGGFDETFVVAGNDVDLCLRLTAAGYRSLCVPHTTLLHDESKSRGSYIDPGDFARSEASYGLFRTVGDPFYNPNLTLARTDCSLRGAEELG